MTEEFPEFAGTEFNNLFTIDEVLPDGSRRNLVSDVDDSVFESIALIDNITVR